MKSPSLFLASLYFASICRSRDHGEGGGGGEASMAKSYHVFAWVDFLGFQVKWIMYDFYHLIAEQ